MGSGGEGSGEEKWLDKRATWMEGTRGLASDRGPHADCLLQQGSSRMGLGAEWVREPNGFGIACARSEWPQTTGQDPRLETHRQIQGQCREELWSNSARLGHFSERELCITGHTELETAGPLVRGGTDGTRHPPKLSLGFGNSWVDRPTLSRGLWRGAQLLR